MPNSSGNRAEGQPGKTNSFSEQCLWGHVDLRPVPGGTWKSSSSPLPVALIFREPWAGDAIPTSPKQTPRKQRCEVLAVETRFPHRLQRLDELTCSWRALQLSELASHSQFCFTSFKIDQPGQQKVIFAVFVVYRCK